MSHWFRSGPGAPPPSTVLQSPATAATAVGVTHEPRAVWKARLLSWWRAVHSLARTAPAQGFFAGSLAAVAAGVVTHPIDLVKVRLQLSGASGEQACVGSRPLGLFGTAAAVVRTDGLRGLYQGISGSVLRQTTVIGCRLGVYDALKSQLARDNQSVTFTQTVACGLAAGAVSAAVCNPADLVLVRMQADGRLPVAQRRGYAHAGEALLRITREEGLLALWRGTTPTVARAMVVANTPVTHGVASLLAGGAAALSSTPFDVVKTRLQNQTARADGSMPYRGVWHCFATTARSEGLLALHKGLLATWARQAPLNTVRFIALEQLRKIL